jgi:STE24 endopeptidase
MLTLLFVVFLLAMVGVRLWLANRQIRHVLSHRAEVPAEFATRIGLASHQKAADYTTARVRLGMLELVFDAADANVVVPAGLPVAAFVMSTSTASPVEVRNN